MALTVKIVEDQTLFANPYGAVAIVEAKSGRPVQEGFLTTREAFKYLINHNANRIDENDVWRLKF